MLAFVLAAALLQLPSAPRPVRPNIVLAIADDLDPDHPGFAGNALARTPNLDRLAAQGSYFPALYVQPVCRASLAVLLSGRWPHESGILNNGIEKVLDPAGTLPQRLAEGGYRSYCAGKFWEGEPPRFGFTAPARNDSGFGRTGDQGELFRFLEQSADEGPWFLWWAPSLPHTPHEPPARFASAFAETPVPIPAGIRGSPEEYVASERACLAMEAWLDDEFGALVAKLQALGEWDQTVVLFLSDNGWATGLPSKGSPSEKGIRSPLIVSVPERTAGRRFEGPVALPDVHATVLDYAGVAAAPGDRGQSLRPWVEDRPGAPRAAVCGAAYTRHGRGGAEGRVYALYARDERWKYVLYLVDVTSADIPAGSRHAPLFLRRAGTEELFDLHADPREEHDLSGGGEHVERLRALRAAATDWWSASGGWTLELPSPAR
jgi:arylsulfatase A-like enzyme